MATETKSAIVLPAGAGKKPAPATRPKNIPSCATCVFALFTNGNMMNGHCHLEPPHATPVLVPQAPKLAGGPVEMQVHFVTGWPAIAADQGCGQHMSEAELNEANSDDEAAPA